MLTPVQTASEDVCFPNYPLYFNTSYPPIPPITEPPNGSLETARTYFTSRLDTLPLDKQQQVFVPAIQKRPKPVRHVYMLRCLNETKHTYVGHPQIKDPHIRESRRNRGVRLGVLEGPKKRKVAGATVTPEGAIAQRMM